MLTQYKATVDGVTVDDVEFKKGEILELDPDMVDITDQLSDGSLEVVPEESDLPPEPTLDGEAEPKEGTHQPVKGDA